MREHSRVPPFAKDAKDGGTHSVGDTREIKSLGHPAVGLVQISRMTIIKTPTSYFACASFLTTSATLSSIWFQPSI